MAEGKIDHLIINSAYEEPKEYWSYDRESRSFSRKQGRRPAGYVVATENAKSFDDPGVFKEIQLVNKIRERVKQWREAAYPGVTGMTKRLLEHWRNPEERQLKFFFCQIEAMETLIWLAEAPDSDKIGLDIPSDGGPFRRLCSMMATGSGKTIVMAMLIAWQVTNKATYPQDTKFSKNVLVVAPGITVRRRLQVLLPTAPGNYYELFNIVPEGLLEKLREAKVKIVNWHALNWETEKEIAKKHSVDKRGVKSDEAYTREVLEELASAHNLIVINDEAHHAWRLPPEAETKEVDKDALDEATIWVGGLDRLHKTRTIQTCYDFTATPFVPMGKKSVEELLFSWIVSSFNLNDAIESGLVKTPRVVVRDDGKLDKNYKSRLYHIYTDTEVKDNLNRKAQEHDPLPDLVINGYYLLGKDWLEAAKVWQKAGIKTPPVMITVANRVETAARVKYAFDHNKVRIEELHAPEKTLHIDSSVLEQAEELEPIEAAEAAEDQDDDPEEKPRKESKKELAQRLRLTVDTVGQVGKLGEQIQNVISVGMLSEGWDAKTVTHIMGLRAFTSQLLCEQVVGRGLRRMSYETNPKTGFFEPEYVNVFGVPFTFLPHESQDGPPPPPPPPKTRIEPLADRKEFEITWPVILRIDRVYRPTLTLDLKKVKTLSVNAADAAMLAELAPVVDGKPDVTKVSEIDLKELGEKFRMQKIVFETAGEVYEQMAPTWKGSKEILLSQLIHLVEKFLASGKIRLTPALYDADDVRRRILLTLNMRKIVQHIWEAIHFENTESIEPIFDKERPIRATGDMQPWFTGKACERTKRSHVNFCVYDSRWEATESFELDRNPEVEAWVKNDHLGFEILYIFNGVVHKYRPDFLIRLKSGGTLVLEVKGMDSQQNKTKRQFLDDWIKAVNTHGGFGFWQWAVSKNQSEMPDVIKRAAAKAKEAVTSAG